MTRRRRWARAGAETESAARLPGPVYDPEVVAPATREETLPIAMLAIGVGFAALAVCMRLGYQLLYGDAVAHLGIARRIVDTRYPGLAQWGSVWLPLPHLLMLPFVGMMELWQNGLAGAFPSLICYVIGMMGFYRLARRMVTPGWALAATAFYGLNANLLYLATTAMTEPLFLALVVWLVLMALEFVEAMREGRAAKAATRMVVLGWLVLAAVMTRYDGWVLGAVVWCVVGWHWVRRKELRRALTPAFAVFTVLCVAGPAMWLTYEHVYSHDWLDFMRGPYSAKEIDRKTSPPGSRHYFGWHDPAWSLMLYARTAQVDASWWETGWVVAAAALTGLWKVWRDGRQRVAALLWVPLPFYVYSVSYGSVPIFIPQIYPHSFYNSRYGMEMLPCFAIFGAVAVEWGARWVKRKNPLVGRVLEPLALALAVLNCVGMLHATPLVLKEAMMNSRGRTATERELAKFLEVLPEGTPVMIDASKYAGALQLAGIPLKDAWAPGDYDKGLTVPAEKAPLVIAGAGDEVARAVAKDAAGLTELSVICSRGESCVRVYRSDWYRP